MRRRLGPKATIAELSVAAADMGVRRSAKSLPDESVSLAGGIARVAAISLRFATPELHFALRTPGAEWAGRRRRGRRRFPPCNSFPRGWETPPDAAASPSGRRASARRQSVPETGAPDRRRAAR